MLAGDNNEELKYEDLNLATDRNEARGNVFDTKIRDKKISQEDTDKANKQNQKAAENEGWGQMIGGWGSAGLAYVLGLTNPFALAAISAAGTYFGGKKGAENVGGYADSSAFRDTFFGQTTTETNREIADDTAGNAEDARLMASLENAFNVYTLSGGPIPGTSSWQTKEEIALADDLTRNEALEGLADLNVAGGSSSPIALATSKVEEAFSGLPESATVNFPELGGLDVDDISTFDMLWQNVSNPTVGNIKKGSAASGVFGLMKPSYDYLNEEPV